MNEFPSFLIFSLIFIFNLYAVFNKENFFTNERNMLTKRYNLKYITDNVKETF
jgi:hypothetical protein